MATSPSLQGRIPPVQSFLARTLTCDKIAIYTVASSSRAKLKHYPAINLLDSLVDCSCESFEMRLYPRAARCGIEPTISTLQFHCPHIKQAMLDCISRGEIIIQVSPDALSEGGDKDCEENSES